MAASVFATAVVAWLVLVAVPQTVVDLAEVQGGRLIVSDIPVAERAWLVGLRPGMAVEGITPSGDREIADWVTLAVTDGLVRITVQRTYPAPDSVWVAASVAAVAAGSFGMVVVPTLALWLLLVPAIVAVGVASDLVPGPVGFLLVLAPPAIGALSVSERHPRAVQYVRVVGVLLVAATAGIWFAAFLGRSDSWAVPRQLSVVVGAGLLTLRTLAAVREGVGRAHARLQRAGSGEPTVTRLVAATIDEMIPGRALTRLSAMERERAALATDLHGEVLPNLAAVIKSVQDGISPAEAAARLQVVASELRELLTDRRLSVLEELGLVPALEWLAERVEERAAVPVQVDIEGDHRSRVPAEVELHAYRIAQQALDNALIHARPTQIDVAVEIASDRLLLAVADDGAGIVPGAEEEAARAGRLGLSDMRQRAAVIGGVLTIGRRSGGGTLVTLRWPR